MKIASSSPSRSAMEKWLVPNYQQHSYPFRGYNRFQILMDLPAPFDGKEESYFIAIEKNETEFFLKSKPNQIFLECHHVNTYQQAKHNRNFNEDSAKNDSFVESSRQMWHQWPTFRLKYDFSIKVSKDLCLIPCKDIKEICAKGKTTNLLIIELCSIASIYEVENQRQRTTS